MALERTVLLTPSLELRSPMHFVSETAKQPRAQSWESALCLSCLLREGTYRATRLVVCTVWPVAAARLS